MDPLAGIKLAASTYGIPPEVTEALMEKLGAAGGGIADLVLSATDANRAQEIASLALAAKTLTEIGYEPLAETIIDEIRGHFEVGDQGPSLDERPLA